MVLGTRTATLISRSAEGSRNIAYDQSLDGVRRGLTGEPLGFAELTAHTTRIAGLTWPPRAKLPVAVLWYENAGICAIGYALNAVLGD